MKGTIQISCLGSIIERDGFSCWTSKPITAFELRPHFQWAVPSQWVSVAHSYMTRDSSDGWLWLIDFWFGLAKTLLELCCNLRLYLSNSLSFLLFTGVKPALWSNSPYFIWLASLFSLQEPNSVNWIYTHIIIYMYI